MPVITHPHPHGNTPSHQFTQSDAFNTAATELADSNLQAGIDHDAQLRFIKKTMILAALGGAICLGIGTLLPDHEPPSSLSGITRQP